MNYDIFISYPSQEFDIAKEIYKHFSTRFSVFMDKISLKCGMDWTEEIPKAQKNSAVTLAIISNNTKKAFYEKEEITRAIKLRKLRKHIIIPIILTNDENIPDLPFGLENIQYLTINDENDINILYNKVVEILKPNIEKVGFETEIDTIIMSDFNNLGILKNAQKCQIEDHITEDQILNFFLKRIQRYSKNSKFFFAFIDIEKFTQINNKYGKKCADDILKDIEIIFKNLHAPIFWHRLFSDEFCILIPNCDISSGMAIMEDLQKNIYLNDWNEIAYGLKVSTSIGISEIDLNKEITKTDVKECIVKAALGCKNIKEVTDSFYEELIPNFKYPKKFPRIKKGPKNITQKQIAIPLRRYSS